MHPIRSILNSTIEKLITRQISIVIEHARIMPWIRMLPRPDDRALRVAEPASARVMRCQIRDRDRPVWGRIRQDDPQVVALIKPE